MINRVEPSQGDYGPKRSVVEVLMMMMVDEVSEESMILLKEEPSD
jgi:hypothetical protein